MNAMKRNSNSSNNMPAHDAAPNRHEEMMNALLNMNNDLTIHEEKEGEGTFTRSVKPSSTELHTIGRDSSFQDFENFYRTRNNLNIPATYLRNSLGSESSLVSYSTLFENIDSSSEKLGSAALTDAHGPASALLASFQPHPASASSTLSQEGPVAAATMRSKQNSNAFASSPSLLALAELVKISPQEYLEDLLQSRGYSTKTYSSLQTAYYNKPTELQIASYDQHLVELVRSRDLDALKEIFTAGISLNPCNSHGESLLHTVCRLGYVELLQFLVNRGACVQLCNDYGKTPMHDACWTSTPNFAVAEMLLQKDRRLFQILDARGVSPLTYVPNDKWQAWIEWLDTKKDLYFPFRGLVELVGEEPAPVLATLPFNSRPIPDTANALTPRLATMLVSGAISVKEIQSVDSNEAAQSYMTLDFDGGEWDCELESDFDSDEEDSYQGSMISEDEDDGDINNDNDEDGMSLSG